MSIPLLKKKMAERCFGLSAIFCYKGFRHSLCHGWASGVLAFIIEYILGLQLQNGGDTYEIIPHTTGIHEIEAKLPLKKGWLSIQVINGKLTSKLEVN